MKLYEFYVTANIAQSKMDKYVHLDGHIIIQVDRIKAGD
jgi:hypothetical protein